ncbi:MAG: ATP-grasp domain-containing protein [Lachnospiraceae bacterium]|nr:ATP-grasp domain-containing protein [Lachnospiraceae bacterium]
MKDLTILKSAVGSNVSPGALACLKNNGERKITIIGVDSSDDPSIRYLVDKFYRVPKATEPGYCDIMLDICRKENVDVYLPSISAEVEVISARHKEFEEMGVVLSASNQNSVSIANNKLKTYQTMMNAGIPVPKFYAVYSIEDFVNGCKELGYPEKAVCLKIVNESGSRGVRIIDANKSRYQIFAHEKPNSFYISFEDMIAILKEKEKLDEMLLVEYMPGNEYTVDLLAENGKVLYMVGRENVVSLMSIAQESILTPNEHAYSVCRKIVELLNMDGNVGFDFMKDENGCPVLMDINPRLTATVSLAAVGGVNFPYLRIKQLLGEELPDCDVNYGIRLKRRYLETFTDVNGNLVEL